MKAKSAINAEFLRNAAGNPMIRFFKDPEFVRSDVIIFNKKDKSLHAVLEGQAHFIGHLDKDEAKAMQGVSEVLLSAAHYKSGVVNLHAALRITDK
ncbi:MAG TPA: hypothetical protein PLO23_06630 [Alphaproteobacteria bacterium]|nr:hypothetical protein [Alphaproteobacteria bacterium]